VLATLWSDYICPWCYLGQDRTALLESLGVTVVARPFELHPETPESGIPLGRRYSRIAAACEELGLPFNAPPRLSNSHRALVAAEWVRLNAAERFERVHRAFFQAYFVDGLDIGDPGVVAQIAGDDVAFDESLLRDAMDDAYDAGIGGTPAWLVDERLLIPGVQDRSYYERMIKKIRPSSQPSS
jgi:predicted DsbA family dithiol-disulfide isomerase